MTRRAVERNSEVAGRVVPRRNRRATRFWVAVKERRWSNEDGPKPEFHHVDSDQELERVLGETLRRLCSREEGLDPRDIVVLAPRVRLVKRFEGKTVGGQKIRPIDRPGGVRIETIHSFKGLEAKCVVLLVAPGDEIEPSLLYVGMSRPKAHLVVIGPPMD